MDRLKGDRIDLYALHQRDTGALTMLAIPSGNGLDIEILVVLGAHIQVNAVLLLDDLGDFTHLGSADPHCYGRDRATRSIEGTVVVSLELISIKIDMDQGILPLVHA
jgi:hypothetical protein